jgi:hypothetical protein
MSYTINYSDLSKIPLIIEDATINANTELRLLGRNVSGYGQHVAQNFLYLLENFASPTAPEKPIIGQLWYDSDKDLLKYYTVDSNWKNANSTTVQDFAPPLASNQNYSVTEGDLWYDTSNNYFYIYSGLEWINILQFDNQNRILISNRYDNLGVLHKTMEFLLNNKIVYLLSTDDTPWTPSSLGTTTERMPDGRLLASDYPTIRKGINLNSDLSYDIHNYFVKRLGQLTIDVGNGELFMEDNSFDGAGPGFTIRTSSDPISSASMFSLRSTNNTSKFWVGMNATTVGNNSFGAGFTGTIGTEFNLDNYNIVLNSNGTISALGISVDGNISTTGNIVSSGTISAAEATGDWIATETDIDEKTSLTKIVTPAMLDYAIGSGEVFSGNTRIVQRTLLDTRNNLHSVLMHIVNDNVVKITSLENNPYASFIINQSEQDYKGNSLRDTFDYYIYPGDNYAKSNSVIINPTSLSQFQEIRNAAEANFATFSSMTLPNTGSGSIVPIMNLNIASSSSSVDNSLTPYLYDINTPDTTTIVTSVPAVSRGLSQASSSYINILRQLGNFDNPIIENLPAEWTTISGQLLVSVGHREWFPVNNLKIRFTIYTEDATQISYRIRRQPVLGASLSSTISEVTEPINSNHFEISVRDFISPILYLDQSYNIYSNIGYFIQARKGTPDGNNTTGTIKIIASVVESETVYNLPANFLVFTSNQNLDFNVPV